MEIRNNLLYGIGFLIISVSIAFYSFFYLPSIEQNRLKLAEQQRLADNETKSERVQKLKTCLFEADNNYSSAWKTACESDNKEADCSLPSDRANALELYKSEEKDMCFKLYD